ncbi:LysR substrate-binding domain-containing protein [Orrella sp. JC864]|uniref:LysR substrate-binding domain-containing protein n=1 Tax=Orrella sp. JC864 TaxID=3120298 RepID=UPI003009924F
MSLPLHKLPNLELVRGFVAVARRMSITLAAQDLHLTQSAVSRQVRSLEAQMGVLLLERGFRAISLTPAGAQLFRLADPWMQEMGELAERLRQEDARRPVTITASIGVAALWILPRLGAFQAAHPHIDVRVAANNRIVDLAREGVDLAIRYGPRHSAPEGARRLFGEHLVPVARPGLLAGPEGFAQALPGLTLLEYDDPARPWLQWPDWLAAQGLHAAKPRAMLRFNQYDQAVLAALAGHGVALGRLPLVAPMLADGRLAALAPHSRISAPYAYWLVRHPHAQAPEAQALAEWVAAQAAAQNLGLDAAD